MIAIQPLVSVMVSMLTGRTPFFISHSLANTSDLSIPSERGLPAVEERKSLNAIMHAFLVNRHNNILKRRLKFMACAHAPAPRPASPIRHLCHAPPTTASTHLNSASLFSEPCSCWHFSTCGRRFARRGALVPPHVSPKQASAR